MDQRDPPPATQLKWLGLGLSLGVLFTVAGFSLRPQPPLQPDQLMPRVLQEVASLTALEQARQAILEKRFDDAKRALERTGEGSPEIDVATAQVRANLTAAEQAQKRTREAQRVAAANLEPRLAEQRRGAPFAAVEAPFGRGEWDLAAQECGRVRSAYQDDDEDPEVSEIHERARRLQELIPTFGRAYDEGLKPPGTPASLVTAYRLYWEMNLRAPQVLSALETRLGRKTVESLSLPPMAALLKGQANLDRLITAGVGLVDEGASSNQELLARQVRAHREAARVEARAEALYRLAYVIRDQDPDQALRKFELVLAVTEPGSFVHEKARKHLLALALRR